MRNKLFFMLVPFTMALCVACGGSDSNEIVIDSEPVEEVAESTGEGTL